MDQQTVQTIRKLKNAGLNSEQVALRLNISQEKVDEGFEIINSYDLKKTGVMQVGYFQKLIERKKEENLSLKGTQKALALNIRALWSMIEMLEQKKKYLDNIIEGMEKYIKKGSAVADIFIEHGIEIDSNPPTP